MFKSVYRTNAFLLHSAEVDGSLGRFSFVGFEPYLVFKSKGMRVTLERPGDGCEERVSHPLKKLKSLLSEEKCSPLKRRYPFFGGAVGYLSYEVSHFFEKLPNPPNDDLMAPDIYLVFVDAILAFDHATGKCAAIACGADYSECVERLHELEKIFNSATARRKAFSEPPKSQTHIRSNFSREAYLEAVKKIKDYIAAGDTFQVNFAQRFCAKVSRDPLSIYERLVKINPAPFAAFLNFQEIKLLSVSPERLVKLEGKRVEARPIAGTRPRGKTPEQDKRLEMELLENVKERAEHTMLVDLARNDLGRVCSYGTVRVEECMKIQRCSYVMHLTSKVVGKLHEAKDRFDLLRAVFPGGTITGCPKVRTMEIISELEPCVRGPYTGSVGYFCFSGNMDLNVAIRTIVIKDNVAYFHAGGGIVADSVPELEYEESLHKAKAMLKAVST